MQRVFILFLLSLVLTSCSNISVSEEEMKKITELAINDAVKKKVEGASAYWLNSDITFNKFDSVTIDTNGVKTKAIPVKVKGKSIICAYTNSGFSPNVTYAAIDDEITINVYRNEVKEMKFIVTDDKSNITNKENYLCGISFDRGIVNGTIKAIKADDSAIIINTTSGEYYGLIPSDNMGKLLTAHFHPMDKVKVHIDNKGPRATDGKRVLYVESDK